MRGRLPSALLAGVLVCAACRDATGPAPDVTVTLSVAQLNGPDVFQTSAGELALECVVELRAVASGATRAVWLDATLLFYAGPDRATALDSAHLSAADVQESWGAPDIGPGETRQSAWRISALIPFGAAFVYRYRPTAGEIRSARVTFTCGPSVPAGAPPPNLSALTMQPAAGEIESGDTLIVEYAAASDVGLWTTRVVLSGACTLEQEFAELFRPSVTRTVVLLIPRACTLGGSLSFTVVATDVAMQSSSAASGPYTVVDRTPPQVFGDRWPVATDYYFAGDTLWLFVGAFDNHAVGAVIWEVQPGGVRDSLSGAGGQFIAIPLRSEWAGDKIQIRLYARDASGLVSDTLVAPRDSLRVYPSVERPTTWTTVTGDIGDLVLDEARGALYLMQGLNGARVAVFSLATQAITETIPLPVLAWGMDLTAGGDSLVLALPYAGALGVIDLRQSSRTVTLVPIRSLDSSTVQKPWQVRVAANGKAFVRLDGSSTAASRLLEVDLVTGAERLLTNAGDNGVVAGARLERSFDRAVLVLQQGVELFQRYDVAQDAFGPLRAASTVSHPLRVDATGARVAVGLDIYDADLQFLRRVASPYGAGFVPGAALSVDGEYLYQAMGLRGVGRSRTSDGALLDRSPTPFPASGFLRVSPNGTILVIADSFGLTSRIALMDLR